MNATLITDYITQLVGSVHKIELSEFCHNLHTRFYSDIDISFMDDFLQLASQENEGQFIVPHQKLEEYGVMTSGRSGNIKRTLERLGLEEGEDYLLLQTEQNSIQIGRPSNTYMLTPESLFLALQRAKKTDTQTIDPKKYAKYFQFIQKCVKYFIEYQLQYEKMISAGLQSKNDSLAEQLKEFQKVQQSIQSDTRRIIGQNEELLGKNEELQHDLNDARRERSAISTKLDRAIRSNETYIRLVVNLAFTPKITKDLLELYSGEDGIVFESRKPWNGIDNVKMFFIFAWIDRNNTHMTIQVACCNFKQTTKRLSELVSLMNNTEGKFINCRAIAIVDKDVNEEKKLFENVFEMTITARDTIKRFQKYVGSFENATSSFDGYVERLNHAFRMRHQQNIAEAILNEGANANGKAAKTIETHFISFNVEALSWCQEFIDAYLITDNNGHVCVPDLRSMSKDCIIDDIITNQGDMIRMNRCNFAKVQLKLCIRNFNDGMNHFVSTLSDSDDE